MLPKWEGPVRGPAMTVTEEPIGAGQPLAGTRGPGRRWGWKEGPVAWHEGDGMTMPLDDLIANGGGSLLLGVDDGCGASGPGERPTMPLCKFQLAGETDIVRFVRTTTPSNSQ